jgi:hypothetical protein
MGRSTWIAGGWCSIAAIVAPAVVLGACQGPTLSPEAPDASNLSDASGTGGEVVSTTIFPPRDADVLGLGPAAVVRQLAQRLWNQPPDTALSELFARLVPGGVPSRRDARFLAEAMIADPRARPLVASFYRWWLNLAAAKSMEKSAVSFPELDEALRNDLALEPELFAVAVTMDDDGRFETLLLAEYTFMSEALARLYGVSGIAGMELRQVSTESMGRPGLLGLAGYVAPRSGFDRTWPSMLGMHLDQDFFCLNVPSEPVPPSQRPKPDPTRSMRRLAQDIAQGPPCQACHKLLDPIGFGFGGFDALGRRQSMDGPDPVDASGQLTVVDPPPSFGGFAELAQLVARSDQARRCHATKWLQFFVHPDSKLETTLAQQLDAGSLEQAFAAFEASGFNLRALVAAVVTSPALLN